MKNEAVFKNRDKAEDAVCQAFVQLGLLAGIDVANGTGPADLDAESIQACYQSNFSDPHFLGGPCCFNYAKTLSQVDQIFVSAFDVSDRLLSYIAAGNDPAKTKAAKVAIAVIEAAKGWMQKVVAS